MFSSDTSPVSEADIVYRPASATDMLAVHKVFRYAIADLVYRAGMRENNELPSDADLEADWARYVSVYEHLGTTAESYWVAVRRDEILGYARSIRRGGLRELTEFFVRPGIQSSGVGKQLLQRAFPSEGAERRAIIASTDVRAQVRYLKLGCYPRFPIYTFEIVPEVLSYHPHLAANPLSATDEMLEQLAQIDETVIGYRRDVDHHWFIKNRKGYLYSMNETVIGYGYIGRESGPFALIDPEHFSAVLAHAETEAVLQGLLKFRLNVPAPNEQVMAYLLERAYQMDPYFCLFMTDKPFGQFDRYIITTPLLFI